MAAKTDVQKNAKSKTKVLVSSAVYGFQDLLDQIYGVLVNLEYEVWMSHKGTLPIDPTKTAMESCIQAVHDCDLFLGIILPRYGSGKETKESDSVTHEELKTAIHLNKPRWILAHDHVVFAQKFLWNLGHKTAVERATLSLEKKDVMEDLRVIDMLEIAMRKDIKLVKDRKGNWVQEFSDPKDANLFVFSQFRRIADAKEIVEENFSKPLDERGNPR
jgi:hypothetical protein